MVGREVEIEGLERPAVITQDGMTIFGADGKKVLVSQLQLEDGRMIRATKWGKEEKTEKLELTEEEEKLRERIRVSQVDDFNSRTLYNLECCSLKCSFDCYECTFIAL